MDWLRIAQFQLHSADKHRYLGPVELRGTRLLDYSPGSRECHVRVIVVPVLSVAAVILVMLAAIYLYVRFIQVQPNNVSEEKREILRKRRTVGTDCACIKELFPMNEDLTTSSEDANIEDPLIQESIVNDMAELIS